MDQDDATPAAAPEVRMGFLLSVNDWEIEVPIEVRGGSEQQQYGLGGREEGAGRLALPAGPSVRKRKRVVAAPIVIDGDHVHQAASGGEPSAKRLRIGATTIIPSSSPSAAAANRPTDVTAPPPRPRPRPSKTTAKESTTPREGVNPLLPTPDTGGNDAQANSTPTSAQRPPPTSGAALSVRQTIRRRPDAVSNSQQHRQFAGEELQDDDDVILDNVAHDDDPAEPDSQLQENVDQQKNDAFAHIDDIDDHELPTRPPRLQDPVEQLDLTTEFIPYSSQGVASGQVTASKTPQVPPSSATSSAFQRLSSSGANPATPGVWTVNEDKKLLAGARKGWTSTQIIASFGLQSRSASSIRNRRRFLEKKYPGFVVPPNDPRHGRDNETVDDTGLLEALPSTQRQSWSSEEISILRKAVADGLDATEIHEIHFPSRPLESIRKRFRSVEPGVILLEKARQDYPTHDGPAENWTPSHDLKLRRAVRERFKPLDARHTWFRTIKSPDFAEKWNAYHEQYTKLPGPDQPMSNNGSSTVQVNTVYGEAAQESARSVQKTIASRPPTRAPVTQMPPPPARRPNVPTQPVGLPSGKVVTPRAERSGSSNSQLTRTDSGQSTLNFKRDKGKGKAGGSAKSTSMQANRAQKTADSVLQRHQAAISNDHIEDVDGDDSEDLPQPKQEEADEDTNMPDAVRAVASPPAEGGDAAHETGDDAEVKVEMPATSPSPASAHQNEASQQLEDYHAAIAAEQSTSDDSDESFDSDDSSEDNSETDEAQVEEPKQSPSLQQRPANHETEVNDKNEPLLRTDEAEGLTVVDGTRSSDDMDMQAYLDSQLQPATSSAQMASLSPINIEGVSTPGKLQPVNGAGSRFQSRLVRQRRRTVEVVEESQVPTSREKAVTLHQIRAAAGPQVGRSASEQLSDELTNAELGHSRAGFRQRDVNQIGRQRATQNGDRGRSRDGSSVESARKVKPEPFSSPAVKPKLKDLELQQPSPRKDLRGPSPMEVSSRQSVSTEVPLAEAETQDTTPAPPAGGHIPSIEWPEVMIKPPGKDGLCMVGRLPYQAKIHVLTLWDKTDEAVAHHVRSTLQPGKDDEFQEEFDLYKLTTRRNMAIVLKDPILDRQLDAIQARLDEQSRARHGKSAFANFEDEDDEDSEDDDESRASGRPAILPRRRSPGPGKLRWMPGVLPIEIQQSFSASNANGDNTASANKGNPNKVPGSEASGDIGGGNGHGRVLGEVTESDAEPEETTNDEDDAELPTAPPRHTVMSETVLSNGQLQDLVQSGDAEIPSHGLTSGGRRLNGTSSRTPATTNKRAIPSTEMPPPPLPSLKGIPSDTSSVLSDRRRHRRKHRRSRRSSSVSGSERSASVSVPPNDRESDLTTTNRVVNGDVQTAPSRVQVPATQETAGSETSSQGRRSGILGLLGRLRPQFPDPPRRAPILEPAPMRLPYDSQDVDEDEDEGSESSDSR